MPHIYPDSLALVQIPVVICENEVRWSEACVNTVSHCGRDGMRNVHMYALYYCLVAFQKELFVTLPETVVVESNNMSVFFFFFYFCSVV